MCLSPGNNRERKAATDAGASMGESGKMICATGPMHHNTVYDTLANDPPEKGEECSEYV